jgi:hypothetical protein
MTPPNFDIPLYTGLCVCVGFMRFDDPQPVVWYVSPAAGGAKEGQENGKKGKGIG